MVSSTLRLFPDEMKPSNCDKDLKVNYSHYNSLSAVIVHTVVFRSYHSTSIIRYILGNYSAWHPTHGGVSAPDQGAHFHRRCLSAARIKKAIEVKVIHSLAPENFDTQLFCFSKCGHKIIDDVRSLRPIERRNRGRGA